MEETHWAEPVLAAQRIVGDLLMLRETLKTTAEGFAALDFAQGTVATELPANTARDIVAVVRGERWQPQPVHSNDLVLFWLENYRRAYSHIIMRVLQEGRD